MKKIIIIMNKVTLCKKNCLMLLLSLSFFSSVHTQTLDTLFSKNPLYIKLCKNQNKVLKLVLMNRSNDTISISNLYHLDSPDKLSYISLYWYDISERKYIFGGLINKVSEPTILLDSSSKKRMIKMLPKEIKKITIGYFGKHRVFLELQTILSYQNKNYFIKLKTNELDVK